MKQNLRLSGSWWSIFSLRKPAQEAIWVVGLLCLFGIHSAALAQNSPEIFRDIPSWQVNNVRAAERFEGLTLVRSRYVLVDLDHLLPQPGTGRSGSRRGRGVSDARLTFNLFSDAIYEFEQVRGEHSTDGRSWIWSGNLTDSRFAQAVLVVRDGEVTGSVAAPNGDFYRIRSAGSGVHVIRQVVYQGSPAIDDAVPVPELKASDRTRLQQQAPVAQESSSTTVDVMVVYTAAARDVAGGTSGMESEIELAIAEINQSYVNSGVQMELRLVRTAEVDYDEQVTIETSLTRLRSTSDGYLDEVHSLRDQYGADVVALLINGPGSSGGVVGIAYIMQDPGSSFAPYAFSVTEINFAAGPVYALSHEIGHNLGCAHDRENAGVSGSYAYSYGFKRSESPDRFRTIMSYNCVDVNCPTINHWSNPDVTYAGNPTGMPSDQADSADNHLTLTNTRTVAAEWRPTAQAAPSAVSVSPSSGSGETQNFTYTFSDADGFADLLYAQMLINGSLSGLEGCYLHYVRSSNRAYLLNDSASAWLGPVTLGTSGTLSNSQCSLDAGASSFSASGSTLTVNVALSFTSGFVGEKSNYMYVQDQAGQADGWRSRGTWTVPGAAANSAPVPIAVSPEEGSGSSQTFTYTFSDPDGYTDLAFAQMLFNGSLRAPDGCYAHYVRATNKLHLLNDDASAWFGPVTLGASGSLSNSQCTLDAGGSSASGSGTTLTINLAATFSESFDGTKINYGLAIDTGGLSSGWRELGAWSVPSGSGNLAPAAVGVAPSGGSGASQLFAFTFSDPNGHADLSYVQMLINGSLSGKQGCYLHYYPSTNRAYLLNDEATVWLGPVSLGAAGTVANSQCSVDSSISSAAGSGDDLTVSVGMTFEAGFEGSKKVFMSTRDAGGLATGWQHRGDWTVP